MGRPDKIIYTGNYLTSMDYVNFIVNGDLFFLTEVCSWYQKIVENTLVELTAVWLFILESVV